VVRFGVGDKLSVQRELRDGKMGGRRREGGGKKLGRTVFLMV
jgi:hypothetical protein